MNIFRLVCLTLIGAVTVSGLAFALYASLPIAMLTRADWGRYAGLSASEPSTRSRARGVRIGALQDHSA